MGGVSNLFGRFRKLPDIYSSDWGKRGGAERRSINTPVQGTGSDILLSAAIEIHKELKPEGLDICGTIHDAIVGEFNEGDEDWIVPEIRRIMIHPKLLDEFGVKLRVNLDVDVGVGPWGTH
jgi:DNA polymerase-1